MFNTEQHKAEQTLYVFNFNVAVVERSKINLILFPCMRAKKENHDLKRSAVIFLLCMHGAVIMKKNAAKFDLQPNSGVRETFEYMVSQTR